MIEPLLDLFRPGRTIYLPGASGESLALIDALKADPGRMRGVNLVSCLLPGMNSFDYAALDDEARVTTFLLPPALRGSFEAGRVSTIPMSYSAIARQLASGPQLDVAIAHVAPPCADGRASLGIAADFTSIAWDNARVRVALVNPDMPDIAGPKIDLADADLVVEMAGPVIQAAAATDNQHQDSIAQIAAEYVPDGATIQVGIGGTPGAIWQRLSSHRNLQLQSGMATDGVRLLEESGALAPDLQHVAGIAYGSRTFYEWLSASGRITLAPTSITHHLPRLASFERFTAINSAIEVDLLGQANLEWQGGRLSSGVGGAPDFARAAQLSAGGRSLILLPATAKGGTISRIVPRLRTPTVSLPRSEVELVITEHGAADLRGLAIDDRAAALISIAAPEWRAMLDAEWSAIRNDM
ncbi:acetyl-CoA hydrolase [Novosphingobium endophyticum]|uniref:Acetyl-CoA hydrolase n=1 Tax=Novosphingobium endophyticum TaxID=1955250 RepID=A0A916TS52_9SPHN|nr:acetyl-CoA hydrolase/transferase C-terminal domain-containing protein [Novosphingobium endophyticum]GGC00670.1 acetyl-CoA hydrolase [Novosphingobium endophyticum]